MELRGPILSATDLSEPADAAIRQGHTLASQLGARFVVGHVLPEAFSVRVLFPQDAGIDRPFAAELERKALAAVRARLETIAADDSPLIPVEIESGTPHAGILSIAERVGAGLIAVGPGATAQRIARLADIPVLVARPSPDDGDVLAATDFSDPSLPALRTAAAEAARRGVRLRVVHCLDIDQAAYVGGAGLHPVIAPWPLLQSDIEQLEAAARQRLSTALADVAPDGEGFVVVHSPAAGILQVAETAATGLIVVGTRGRSGLARLALGSVAEAVMTRAACSVLAVPLHPA